MYKRNKKVDLKQTDVDLLLICDDLLYYNNNATFAIFKKYYETTNVEIQGEKLIVSSVPIEKLHIPSEYKVNSNGVLTLLDENYVLGILIHSDLTFLPNGKINEFYLDFDKQKEIEKVKNYQK